jgi:hypothetical protein
MDPPGRQHHGEEGAESLNRDRGDHDSHAHTPQDPVRMQLLDHERQWVLAVKAALQSDPELDQLSDFMYAQIAIVESGDIEKAIERAHKLQHYRQEYDIRENYAEGKRAIEAFTRKFPSFLLHFQYMQILGVLSIMLDFCNFDTAVFSSVEGEKVFFAAVYYMNHAFNIDFEAVRTGPL